MDSPLHTTGETIRSHLKGIQNRLPRYFTTFDHAIKTRSKRNADEGTGLNCGDLRCRARACDSKAQYPTPQKQPIPNRFKCGTNGLAKVQGLLQSHFQLILLRFRGLSVVWRCEAGRGGQDQINRGKEIAHGQRPILKLSVNKYEILPLME